MCVSTSCFRRILSVLLLGVILLVFTPACVSAAMPQYTEKDYVEAGIIGRKNSVPDLQLSRETAVSADRRILRGGHLVKTGSSLRYKSSNGKYLKNGWRTVSGKTYYFNSRSYAVTGMKKISGKYHIFNKNGVMQKGWVKYGRYWYYASRNKGVLRTGWKKVNGKKYYLSKKTRRRVSGFQKIDGKTYYFNASGVLQTKSQYINGKYLSVSRKGVVKSYKVRESAVSKGQQVVNYAVQFVGNPYRWGGSSLTNGADCSGFVMAVYAHFGIYLPHYDASIRQCGRSVSSLSLALPGDVICYDGHVAIYMGNNRIVHAADYRYGICISNNAAFQKILSIRRFF